MTINRLTQTLASALLALAALGLGTTAMAQQFAYPDGTIGDTSGYTFTTDGHWQDVGEGATPDDTDYIQSTSNSTIEFTLTDSIIDPGVDTGHILRFRARNASNKNYNVTISLYEGANLVGENTIQIGKNTGTFSPFSYTIPTAVVSVYNDLSIRIGGNGSNQSPVEVSWVALETPASLVNPPTVDTPTFASVTDTTAILGGTVSDDGGGTVTDRGTVWGISPNPTGNALSEGSGLGTFSHLRSGLPSNTTIYFRAYATNSAGTAYSADGMFTTNPPASPPTVDTPTFASVTATSAVLGGTVSDDGGATVTDRGTVWGTAPNPTGNALSQGSGIGTFSHLRTSLQPGTLIYFRAYATNSAGTSYSADGSFTTLVTFPTVDTPTVANIGATTAELGGTVSSDGGATVTDRGTVWSTSPNPTLANNPLSEGSGTGTFSHLRTGLPEDTLVYFRAYATNSEGTAYSDDATFTPSVPDTEPVVELPTVTGINYNSAILGGTITDDGGDPISSRGTVWGTTPGNTDNLLIEGGTALGLFSHLRTGMSPGTTIYYRAFATNGVGTGYSPEDSFVTGTEPAVQASNIQFTRVAARSLRIEWTRGDGEGSILVLRLQSTGRTDPADGDDYVADPDFTLAPELPTNSQNFVIYKGTGSAVVATGLTANTTYTAAVYEFAGTGAGTDYLLGPAEASQATNGTLVHNLDFGIDCTDCHNNHGQFIPRDTAQKDVCVTCHNATGPAAGKLAFDLHLVPNSNPAVDFVDCGTCHEVHNPGTEDTTTSTHPITSLTQDNLSFLRANVDKYVPTAQTPAVFHTPADDYAIENGTDTTARAICQACHTLTNYHTNNPSTSGSEQCHDGENNDSCAVEVDCSGCHAHDNRYIGVGGSQTCIECHQSAQGGRDEVVSHFSRLSHHVPGTLDEFDCEVCHDQSAHTGNQVTLWDADDHSAPSFQLGIGADPLVDDGESDKIEGHCLSCHDADGAQAEAAPFAPFNGSGAPPIIDATNWIGSAHNRDFASFPASPVSCMGDGENGCHGSGHGSELTFILTPPDTLATPPEFSEQKEGLCFTCHDNNGPSSFDTEAEFNQATNFQVTSNSGALVNQRHDVLYDDQANYSGAALTCSDCHFPHADTSANPVSDPDDGSLLPAYSPSGSYNEDGTSFSYNSGGNLNPINPEGATGGPYTEPDYIQFCLACHDGTVPPGVVMSAGMINIASIYGGEQHGGDDGSTGSRTGKGNLKPPYNTTANYTAGDDPTSPYAAMNCNTCHGPHGTGNIFNLRESITVAGVAMTIGGQAGSEFDTFSGTTYTLPENGGTQGDHEWGAWCTFCHNMNAHAGVDETTTCTSGHMHGGSSY